MTAQEGDKQGSKSSRPSTVAVDVDASMTNREVMATRLRECTSDPSHCDSTARMSVQPPPQPLNAAPASSRRSHSAPAVDNEELERQREAARRSANSDYAVEYANEYDNTKVWQHPGEFEAATEGLAADAQPQVQGIAGADQAQQGCGGHHGCSADEGQQEAAEAAEAGGCRHEEGGGSPANCGGPPPSEVNSPGFPRQGEDAVAAEVRQKLHQKLEDEGKLQLEPLAADWEMGRRVETNGSTRMWFQPPRQRKILSCAKAVEYLENLHAERQPAATLPGACVLPCRFPLVFAYWFLLSPYYKMRLPTPGGLERMPLV